MESKADHIRLRVRLQMNKDTMGIICEYLDIHDYYNITIAFRQKNKRIERKKSFEWALNKARIRGLHDGYCMFPGCFKRKAACVIIKFESPIYKILSNYCSRHADRDLLQ